MVKLKKLTCEILSSPLLCREMASDGTDKRNDYLPCVAETFGLHGFESHTIREVKEVDKLLAS